MATRRDAPRWEVVPMRLGDLDHVMEIERSSFRSPWPRQVFMEELEREWAHLVVVRDSVGRRARIVAYCNFWHVRDEVHILNIATLPDERRQGHAARLMDHVLAFATRHGCAHATLEVRRSNQGAQAMYKRFGFRAVGLRPNYYAEDREDAIIMLKEM